MRRTALLLATLSLASCGYGASRQAHEAQTSMIGMTAADLTACAGPPAKTTKLNPSAEVDTYTYTPPAGSGFNLTLPLSLAPVIRGCKRQPEASMQPVTGKNYDDSSAYHSPAVPPQPAAAQDPNTPPVSSITGKP
jgi:hypothetical protein